MGVAAISSALVDFPAEAQIIGMLVVGYGEIEFDLAECLVVSLGDTDTALRAVYRSRGEDYRINLIDALARAKFAKAGLEDEFCAAVDGVRHCKNIRNQYAHCTWISTDAEGQLKAPTAPDGLRIVLLEEHAKGSGPMMIGLRKITLDLLKQQEAFFLNVAVRLRYLKTEYASRQSAGALSNRTTKAPKRLEKPPLNIGPK